jgi:hypothetical protein
MIANTGELAIRFNEEGINSSGSLTSSLRNPSDMQQARAKAAASICKISDQRGEPLGITVARFLSHPESIAELQSYVQTRGETPDKDPSQLAIQAAMLRATEIGTVAKAIDITDRDALGIIEDSEQQHIEDNTGETAGILSPDTAGALSLLVHRISSAFKKVSGSGSLRDWVVAVKHYTGSNSFNGINHGGMVNNLGDINYTATYLPETDTSNTDTSNDPVIPDNTGGGSNFWDNLFTGIDKVVGAVGTVTGAINTTVGNVNTTAGGIINTATDIGGQAGQKAISGYIKDNIVIILAVVAGIILLIVILSRAASR